MKLRKSTSTAELLHLDSSKVTWMSQEVGKWLVDGLFHLLVNGGFIGVVTHGS